MIGSVLTSASSPTWTQQGVRACPRTFQETTFNPPLLNEPSRKSSRLMNDWLNSSHLLACVFQGAGIYAYSCILNLHRTTFFDNAAAYGGCDVDIASGTSTTSLFHNLTFLPGTVACSSNIMVSIRSAISFTCPPGGYIPPTPLQWTPTAFSGCLSDCQAGYFGNASGVTDATCSGPCPDGHYCEAGTVVPEPCGNGTYALPGVLGFSPASCLPCTPGTYNDALALSAASCTPCRPGSFSAGLRSAACAPCPRGGYCADEGAASAAMAFTPCPAGTFNPDEGAVGNSSCLPCPKGTANPASGSSSVDACATCNPGTFAERGGSTVCTVCPAGTTTAATFVACDACRPGFFKTADGECV